MLFIAGAGISRQAPACLPDFGKLVHQIVGKLDEAMAAHLQAQSEQPRGQVALGELPSLNAEQAAILGRIRDKEYDVALGMMERRMDRDQDSAGVVRRAVADILRLTEGHAPIHTSLVRLADRGGATAIATTNFALLLESAARARHKPVQRYGLHDIPRPSLLPEFGGVLHLHGALDPDPGRHADLVLTDRDFGEHYLRRRAIPDLIYDAARIFHVVMVGYSLTDPPMRYLLNAVAADGQRFSDLRERFAFVGMDMGGDTLARADREAELATWKGRGITPIPYDKADGHRALADVLAAWADLSPHDVRNRAGREVRRICRLERAAASESSAAMFGHFVRRGSDAEQRRIAVTIRDLRADPAWLDGALEIVREKGGAEDRDWHATQLCQIVLDRRLTDGAMLRWAAGLKPHQASERRAVANEVEWRLDQSVPEPWRTAWRLVADAHLAPVVSEDRHEDHRLERRVKSGDRSSGLIANIARLVAPRLDVGWRAEMAGNGGHQSRKPRAVGDLLILSLTSGRVELGSGLSLDGVNETAFLVELAEALEAEVVRGLQLGRRIGWHRGRGPWWLGGLDRIRLRHGDQANDPDRFHTGIAPAVRVLMHALDRLATVDAAAARPFLQRWLARSDSVHQRMWAAAAISPALADADQASNFLMQLSPEHAWEARGFPEFAELRAVRFPEFGTVAQRAITDTLLRGPPSKVLGRHGTAEERKRWRVGLIVRELTRIEATGAELPPRARDWLSEHRSAFEEFVAGAVDSGFPVEPSAGWVSPSPDADLDALDGEVLPATIDARLRSGGSHWDGPSRGARDWIKAPGRPLRLARALIAAPDSTERFGMAWDVLGHYFRPQAGEDEQAMGLSNSLPVAREVLRAVLAMSDPVLGEATSGLADWLANWARHLGGDGEVPRAIARIWPFAVASGRETKDPKEYEDETRAEAKRVSHDSLNSPIGDLTGAFLGVCPGLAKVARPFEVDADLRVVRDLVAQTPGRPGIVARYRCTTALPWFMRADPAWTEEALLSRLEAGPESDILWHAVAYSDNRRHVVARLGRLMARRAMGDGLEKEIRRSLVERVCFALLNDMLDGLTLDDFIPDALQMLRSVPDELRADAARAVERFANYFAKQAEGAHAPPEEAFDRAIQPFMQRVWPQERILVTPATAKALASIPAASGRRFAAAVAALRRFLVPFESWSVYDWGIEASDGHAVPAGIIVGANEAAAALDLLDLTIGHNPDVRVPRGLDLMLATISAQGQALRRDARFRRLEALLRQ